MRHLIKHRNGIVDDEYIKNTNDQLVRIGQEIKPDTIESIELANSIKKIATNFFTDFESMLTEPIE